uniref:PHD-type domain-containing protein n=1 Tax=Cuerna arida TaxID=1464854 RepID=A0A1B6H4Z9_9HEMI
MGEPAADVEITPKKIRKSRWGPIAENELSETETMGKLTEEPQKIIPNGTGNGVQENLPEKTPIKEKQQKTIKITKISKSAKSEKTKEVVKSTTKEEPGTILPPSCDSPTSSKSSGDSFHGFDNEALSEEQLKKQGALQRLLVNLKASGNVSSSESSSEEEQEPAAEQSDVEGSETGRDEEMTVDTDSDQMEIDIGNDKENLSKADSMELSDVGTNRKDGENRTRDSDVDVVETDSVKSGGDNSPSKSQKAGDNKTDSKVKNSSILESTLKGGTKVEYCGGCAAEVDDAEEGICCDGDCERWFHLRCSGLSQAEYDELGLDENAKWACTKCSGTSPPSLAKKNTKPLLSVRKDLGTLSTPSPKRRSIIKDGRTPRVDISNPAFLKPFDFGWKRELVYRSTNDSQNRRQGDIYYYTPKGKKLRSLREISDHLVGTDLTQDNFTFWKEPLGIDDPEKEIIRDAKFKMVNKDPLATPSLPKKVTPKITKTPKPAPKLTATVTPLDSSNSSISVTPKASASVTPRVVFKGKASLGTGPKFKVTPTKTSTTPSQTQKIVISKGNEKVTLSKKTPPVKNYTEIITEENKLKHFESSKHVDNEIETEEDIEVNGRKNFKRYGLLANAKSPWKKPTESNSSSSCSEDLSDSSPEKLDTEIRTLSVRSVRSRRAARTTSHGSKVTAFNLNEDVTSHQNKKKTLVHPLSKIDSNNKMLTTSSSPEKLPSENSVKRPPEIQFRPSNPSSYGCQTSPVKPRRLVGPSASPSVFNTNMITCNSPFETVLIVDTASTDTYINSPKRRDASYESPLIVNNSDCSIEIISVESLGSKEQISKFDKNFLVASPSNQSSMNVKKKSSVSRISDNRVIESCFTKGSNFSPVSIGSSSTEEIVVVDDDIEDNSSPPFLMRNSPPPKMRNVSSPNRSPPSLKPILSPPPLVPCPKRTDNSSLPSCSFSNKNHIISTTPDDVTQQLNVLRNTDSYQMDYRKLKKERFHMRQKAKKAMEKLKRSYVKEKELFVKRKSEEKKLRIQYLELKVKMKELKMELVKKQLGEMGSS